MSNKIAAALPLIPLLAVGAVIPASAAPEEPEPFAHDYDMQTIQWAGHEWSVRDCDGPYITWGGPQAAYPETERGAWIPGATVTPQGDLVLENRGIDGAVEVTSVESMGYGTYSFTYEGNFDAMDPNNVLGIFTYDTAEMVLNQRDEVYENGLGHTEIDFIEISRWGNPDRKLPHGGVTYYPDDSGRFEDRVAASEFNIPAGHQTLTTVAEWTEDAITVTTTTEDGRVLNHTTSTERVPDDRNQQLKLNLWTTNSDQSNVNGKPAYAHAEGDRVVFTDFSYVPEGEEAPADNNTPAPAEEPVAPAPETPAEEEPSDDEAPADEPETPAAPETPTASATPKDDAASPSAAPATPSVGAPTPASPTPVAQPVTVTASGNVALLVGGLLIAAGLTIAGVYLARVRRAQ